jgi:dihydrodipicolinate synthase/N-acetylneuraminate lyase
MLQFPEPPAWVRDALRTGIVIPAHPLALTTRRRLDERRQRGLTRYYHAAGAGGIAVAVHTTQFEIRDGRFGLLAPVLRLASETMTACDAASGRLTVRIAGVCGPTRQAVAEAESARELGYHAGLLSLSALKDASDGALLAHCKIVAREIPLIGFYLQPAVGGRVLSYQFWRRFVSIPNVLAVKIAPFNRYRTLDVVRAVADSGRGKDVALYTGNDDNIILDLLTQFQMRATGNRAEIRIVGGLLGQWACWTSRAVELLNECHKLSRKGTVPGQILTVAAQLTDANAAIFDAANNFSGCIAGIHEVLRRQGLLENLICLDPKERLSPGQRAEIDRVCRSYPHLTDDAFVVANRDRWLN